MGFISAESVKNPPLASDTFAEKYFLNLVELNQILDCNQQEKCDYNPNLV